MTFRATFRHSLHGLLRKWDAARRPARTTAQAFHPGLEELESRWLPSVTLGSAGDFGVLGLQNTQLVNSNVTVTGNEGVSQGGALTNMAPSTITGNVSEYTAGQYTGPGHLDGSISVNAAQMSQVDAAALNAASQAATLTPTQTFGSITSDTTVTGNGGVNVLQINGNITASLILSGTTNDIFIVNVSGSVNLVGSSTLGLAGGVTANHVLYNFTGSNGNINTHVGNVLNGTLLAPTYSFNLDGTFNGEIIGGGSNISLLSGAKVNQVSFSGTPPASLPPADASLSGSVFNESNNGGQGGIWITLTNTATGSQWTTYTASNGTFSFSGLTAGTYTITETLPSGWQNDVANNQVGSLAGSSSSEVFSGIVVQTDDNGTGYNFEDYQSSSGPGSSSSGGGTVVA
ncbi:MAG TPA: carboxypeptidase regulatory-like domain-containing protein [Gemmataceae bacterium]|nr:carboxypeptidase regulatory-like domain-containing protein [Gemmataceae bacterium]